MTPPDYAIIDSSGQHVGALSTSSPVAPQGQGVSMQFHCKLGQSNEVHCRNYMEGNNPSGGYAHGPGMCISWQDGPRGKDVHGNLAPANGAFVEDALVAARQRLAFFQDSQYAHPANAEAMEHILAAINALHARASERTTRGVLGQNIA